MRERRSRELLVLTCEHASSRVPVRLARYFRRAGRLLASHRGWDIGARAVAAELARLLGAPLFAAEASRLVVDLNRSLHHPRLFSRFTAKLPEAVRQSLVARYWRPHRRRVEEHIERLIGRGARVLHVAVHSFTPVLAGEVRRADVGLLYDPRRARERALCRDWQRLLASSDLRVRRNYPYQGRADGFATYLRARFADRHYAGIELELNQRLLATPGPVALEMWRSLSALLAPARAATG